MFRRPLGILVTLALALLLASCGNPDGPGGGTPAPERATFDEAVGGLNTLMADFVSVASGIASNSTFTEGGGFPNCEYCGLDSEVLVSFFPGIFLMFYEYTAEWEATNVRLASGTYTYDEVSNTFTYDAQPADSLIVSWPHAGSGDMVKVRLDWHDIVTAKTYDHEIYLPYVPYVPTYLFNPPYFLTDQELEVPGRISLSAKQGDNEIIHLDVEQTWAETSCGRLLEYRTVNASGFFRSGTQVIELESFLFDHSEDEAVAISLEGSVASGSLRVPFSAAADFTAGAVTRSAENCQLNGIEGPFDGSFDLHAGQADSGIGLSFDWGVTFEDGDLAQPRAIELDSAKLTVGRKYVDITGSLDADAIYGYAETVPLLMTFADRADFPIADFFLELTLPDVP